jgi:hypothetical protein
MAESFKNKKTSIRRHEIKKPPIRKASGIKKASPLERPEKWAQLARLFIYTCFSNFCQLCSENKNSRNISGCL